jgi:post-segregation antitoxin (ccd killing protein)
VELGKQVNVTIYIDEDVVKEAKEIGLNISKICENALKEAIRKLKGKNPGNKTENWSGGQDLNLRHSGFCTTCTLGRLKRTPTMGRCLQPEALPS